MYMYTLYMYIEGLMYVYMCTFGIVHYLTIRLKRMVRGLSSLAAGNSTGALLLRMERCTSGGATGCGCGFSSSSTASSIASFTKGRGIAAGRPLYFCLDENVP